MKGGELGLGTVKCEGLIFEHSVVVNERGGEGRNCWEKVVGDQSRDGVAEGVACVSFALLEVKAMSDLDDGGVGGGVRAQKVEAFKAVENMAGAASFSGEHEIGGDACHRGVSIGYV